jgi:hypothetical protein
VFFSFMTVRLIVLIHDHRQVPGGAVWLHVEKVFVLVRTIYFEIETVNVLYRSVKTIVGQIRPNFLQIIDVILFEV